LGWLLSEPAPSESSSGGRGPPGEEARLKRVIGVWGSFAMGYADVGADVYIDPKREDVIARCREEEPEFREIAPGHWCACHLV